MGVFGRGQEVQFFISESDEREFLQMAMIPNIFIIVGDVHDTKEPKLYRKIPDENLPSISSNRVFYLFNRNIESKLKLDYSEKLKAYMLRGSESPIIQFLRSAKEGSYLTSGRIAAMLSHYYYDEYNKKHELIQPQSFIVWWETLKKYIKKTFTKCYLLDPITKKKRVVPMWAGKGAIKLYESGVNLVDYFPQKGYPLMTYHPEVGD